MNRITKFFKMLSDGTRLRIVTLLAQGEMCVCQICGVLDISQPKASKHLAKLRNMGFVVTERKEQYIYYSLNIEDIVVNNLINDIVNNVDKYEQLKKDKERLVEKETYLKQCGINNK